MPWTEMDCFKFPALFSLNCKSLLLSPGLQKKLLKDYRLTYHHGASEARECILQGEMGKLYSLLRESSLKTIRGDILWSRDTWLAKVVGGHQNRFGKHVSFPWGYSDNT